MLQNVDFLQIRDTDNFWNSVTFSCGLPSALYRVVQKSTDATDNVIIELHLQNSCVYLLSGMFFLHGHLTNLRTRNYILKIFGKRYENEMILSTPCLYLNMTGLCHAF
jgi:hypothetical protein